MRLIGLAVMLALSLILALPAAELQQAGTAWPSGRGCASSATSKGRTSPSSTVVLTGQRWGRLRALPTFERLRRGFSSGHRRLAPVKTS